jgi:PAS domain-containing protein
MIGVRRTPEPSTVHQHVRQMLLRLRDHSSQPALEAKTPLPQDVSAALDLVALVDSRPVASLQWAEMHYADILAALPLAVYATDTVGQITFYNEAAVALWGRRPVLGQERWCGSWRIYALDGSVLPHDHCPMAVALREDRRVRGVTAVAERPDGSRVHFMPFPTPLHDADNKLVGAMNVLIDFGAAQH